MSMRTSTSPSSRGGRAPPPGSRASPSMHDRHGYSRRASRRRACALLGCQAALATDPTSGARNPPALRAPNGVLEDSFYQATGRRMWNAANIYVPTLLIAGEDDTWSFPQDREGLMRDLTNAPQKMHVTIPHATHFVLFEEQRFLFFEEIASFLKSGQTASR